MVAGPDPPVSGGGVVDGTDGCGFSWFPRMGEHPGFTLWRASLAVVAAMVCLAVLHVGGAPAWAAVTVVTGWAVTWARPVVAALAAGFTWTLETGFAVHHHGELSATAGDLRHLLGVCAVVVAVAVVSRRAWLADSHRRV